MSSGLRAQWSNGTMSPQEIQDPEIDRESRRVVPDGMCVDSVLDPYRGCDWPLGGSARTWRSSRNEAARNTTDE